MALWPHLQATAIATWLKRGPHDHGAGWQSKPLSFYSTSKWSCFDLLYIRILRSAFHFFAGDLKFCKVTPFHIQGWLTLGCKCTCTLKQRIDQKTLHTSGLERSVAPLKCHFVTPCQRIIFCVPARFLYRHATIVSVFNWKMKDEKRTNHTEKIKFHDFWEEKCNSGTGKVAFFYPLR